MKIRTLSSEEIYKTISMEKAVDVLLETFTNITQKKVNIPDRILMKWDKKNEPNPLAVFMPATFPQTNQLGIKVATLVPENRNRNLPLIHALVMLLDGKTGQPKAILEGSALTAIKTGAASGVATKLLAKKNASSAAIVGCGKQARSQLKAICAVRPIKKIWLYDSVRSQAKKFAEEISNNIAAPVSVEDSVKKATENAEIICTATTSKTPILNLSDVKPNTHINAIGGHSLENREVSWDIINQSFVVVEQREATLRESCEKNFKELGELIQEPNLRDIDSNKFTLFASVGTAALDISIAETILNIAEKQNIGSTLNL